MRRAGAARNPEMTARSVEPERMRGIVYRGRVTLSYEPGVLSHEEAGEFAALAARGIQELEQLAGLPARTRVRFELRSTTRISSARGRTIQLPIDRVAARSAPYLHEIAHVLLPCRHAPAWFSEGLASYLECVVSERGGGYDSRLFTSEGNRGVDADAEGWLAEPRGQRVLPFIGTRGTPAGIVADRHNIAAPFYVLAHSLVKFMAEQAGLSPIIRLARARRFAGELRRLTGKRAAAWRAEWLRAVRPPVSRQSSSKRNTRGG